jgi:hypothetical protein
MLSRSLPAFFDELEKIATAGDLMTPAVVSDSATVDGPPATAFAKNKPRRKTASVDKEAGFKDFAHRYLNSRSVQKSMSKLKVAPKKVQETASQANEAATDLLRKGYVKSPEPVQKAIDKGSELLWKYYHQ